MKVPYRSFNGPSAILRRDAPTATHGGGEKIRTVRDYVPRASPSHRLPHHVNALVIDGELLAQSVDNLERLPRSLPHTGDHLVHALFQLCRIVVSPSAVVLRRQD